MTTENAGDKFYTASAGAQRIILPSFFLGVLGCVFLPYILSMKNYYDHYLLKVFAGHLTRTVRAVAVAPSSDGAARPATTRTASAASSDRGTTLVATARGSSTPTRWRPVVPHDGRGTTHWRSLFLNQDCTGCDFLAVDLSPVHVLDGIFRPVRIYKVYVAETTREGLEPVHGKIDAANFAVRSEDL